MRRSTSKLAASIAVGAALGLTAGTAAAQEKGGILKYVIPSNPPSADAHRETTFGTIHPFAQFYSTLIRVNPDNPSSPTDIVCDLCVGNVPAPANGGKKYTFKIRRGVKWHTLSATSKAPPAMKDASALIGGTELNAHDIVATFKKIIWPP